MLLISKCGFQKAVSKICHNTDPHCWYSLLMLFWQSESWLTFKYCCMHACEVSRVHWAKSDCMHGQLQNTITFKLIASEWMFFVASLKDKITYKFNTLQGRNNYSVLKSFGECQISKSACWAFGVRLEMCLQDWASSSCQHSSAYPHLTKFYPQHVLFLYSCFRFPITLTFASNRIKTYIEKAVIISEKWVL